MSKDNQTGGTEYKTFAFSVKAAEGDGSTGEGIASAFYNIDSYGDIVDDTFFDDDLIAERLVTEGFMGGLNHDWDNPIGRFTKAEKEKIGLLLGWQISDTAHGRDVKTLLRDGVVRKLSIGYETIGREWLETADDVNAYWQKKGYTPSAQDIARAAQGGIRLLTKGRTFEASPVVVPANERADIRSVKSVETMTERDFERLLRESGFSRTQAVAVTASGFKALQREAGEQNKSASTTDILRLRHDAKRRQAQLAGGINR